jgi:hypothetical protein
VQPGQANEPGAARRRGNIDTTKVPGDLSSASLPRPSGALVGMRIDVRIPASQRRRLRRREAKRPATPDAIVVDLDAPAIRGAREIPSPGPLRLAPRSAS